MMKKKKTMFWGAIYGIALVTVLVIVYVLPSVAGLFDRSYVAKYGNVEVKDETEGYIVRNETVYTAAKSGTVKRYASEGELVKGASKVVKISGEGASNANNEYDSLLKKMKKDDAVINTDNGNTQHPGYITYRLDGLEYLNSENIFNMSESQFEKLGKSKLRELADGKVAKGEPIFKVIENGSWWYVFYADADIAKHYVKGQNVKIAVGDKNMNAIIVGMHKGKGKDTRVIIRCRQYFDGFTTGRLEKADVTAASSDGVVILTKSIVKKNGKQGVITKDKIGRLRFKAISIKANNGEKAAVYENIYMDSKGNYVKTINTYDEVVKSPSKRDINNAKDVSK